jgi:hypothetical protein
MILLFIAISTIHAKKMKAKQVIGKEHLRKYEAGSFKPMRIRYIHADASYGNTDNTYSKEQFDKLTSLYFKDASSFFQKFLSLYPLTSENKITTSPKAGCTVGSTFIPASKIKEDLIGYDYVFYINPGPMDSPNAKASAASCGYSKIGGIPTYTRPVAGKININPNFYRLEDTTLSEFDIQSRRKTIMHETTHALAFSPGNINKYIDDEGSDIPDANLIKDVTIWDGKTITPHLIDPRIQQVVRDYYNCPSAIGMPLHFNKAHFHSQPLLPG